MAGARVSVDLAPSKLGIESNQRTVKSRARTGKDLSTSGLADGRTSRAESGTVVRFTMDFHGQVLAERMYQIILVMAGIIAFVAGYT